MPSSAQEIVSHHINVTDMTDRQVLDLIAALKSVIADRKYDRAQAKRAGGTEQRRKNDYHYAAEIRKTRAARARGDSALADKLTVSLSAWLSEFDGEEMNRILRAHLQASKP